jgi:secretory carrier-associated membrane protein
MWRDFDLISDENVIFQQVYMYFRGSGKEAEMRRQAAQGALRAAF